MTMTIWSFLRTVAPQVLQEGTSLLLYLIFILQLNLLKGSVHKIYRLQEGMCLFTLCQNFSKFDNQIEVAISPILT